jgi:pyridoxamine 5'-phosphate oxidase
MSPALPEPLARFQSWWDEAHEHDPGEHTGSMVISSVDDRGRPSSRVVLLRGFDERGFVFYTNLESRKGGELGAGRFAALNFYWPFGGASAGVRIGRQVRVEGSVEQVADEEADAYFAGRPRDSQLGAWASDQSRPLESREALLARLDEVGRRFEGRPVPRPPHWSGLRIAPEAIELWQAGAFRLHTRERYERSAAAPQGWHRTLLFP